MQANRGLVNQIPKNKNPFMSNVLGPQYNLQKDGSYRSNVLNMLTNSGFVGAVSGTPGTAPTGWMGLGTTNGITMRIAAVGDGYIDVHISGTASAQTFLSLTNTAATASAATIGMVLTAYADVSLIAGTFAGVVNPRVEIQEYNGTTYLAASSTVISGGMTVHTRTLTQATVNAARMAVFACRIDSATTVDFTVRISNPQLTEGATARPYVKSPVSGPALGDVVDVIGGRKMLRTCGAVTNLVPNSECVGAVVETNTLPTGWRKLEAGLAISVIEVGNGYVDVRVIGTSTGANAVYFMPTHTPAVVGEVFTGSVDVEIKSGSAADINFLVRERSSSGETAAKVVGGKNVLTRTLTNAATVGVEIFFLVAAGISLDCTLRISKPQLTKSAYPLPYVPTRGTTVTMPASHATTTNGPWFGLPQYDDAESSDGLFKRDGVELITNGTFDNNSSDGWVLQTGWSVANNALQLNTGVDTYKNATFSCVLTEGVRYRCHFNANFVGRIIVRLTAPVETNLLTVLTTNGVVSFDFTAPAGATGFRLHYQDLASVGSFDNISIQKLIPATKTNKVWAALDGEPDGVELVGSVAPTISQGTSSLNTFTAPGAVRIHSLTGEWSAISFGTAAVGARYRIVISNYSGTGFVKIGNLYNVMQIYGNGSITWTSDSTILSCNRLTPGVPCDVTFSISFQRIQPKPMTLAWRGVMGVGSGDLVASQYPQVLTCTASGTVLQYFGDNSGSKRITYAWDGTTYVSQTSAWDRGITVLRFTQINTAGTRLRIGYVIVGIHTTIQWSHSSEDSSTWAVYDGSFNPSTLYKLMLGLNNIYPMWHDTIALWDKQIDDATLLKEMLK